MTGRRRNDYVHFLHQALSADVTVAGARAILDPLLTHDAESGGDLIHTLRTYFACGANGSRAAQSLFLHRNGLLYRLGRVEELLGVPLTDRDVALALELALRATDTCDGDGSDRVKQ